MSDSRDVRFRETPQPADSSDSKFIPVCIIFFSDSGIGGLEMPLLEALSFDSSHGLTVGCTLRSTDCHLSSSTELSSAFKLHPPAANSQAISTSWMEQQVERTKSPLSPLVGV